MRTLLLYHAIFSILCIFPVINIFLRTGVNQYFALLLFVPFVGEFLCGFALSYSAWNLRERK